MKTDMNDQPRVLHLIKSLPPGGIETWLVHIFRQQQAFSVRHELLLMKEEPGVYEPEVRRLGIRIHKLPMGSRLSWFLQLYRFLRRDGSIAALHSHIGLLFAGPALLAAKAAGVKVRIAHSHEARSQGQDYRSPVRRLARRAAMFLIRRAATRRIGITEAAIVEVAGAQWRNHSDASILLYGFDYDRNEGAEARAEALRRELGIPSGATVIGHVGRFDPVKNHAFLLRTFAIFAESAPDAHLVLIGKGRLQPDIERLGAELGVADRVHFAGTTSDVPAFMTLFDLFVFPSFSEGLGIVCIEAQAAGTRSLVSTTVPREAEVVPGGVEFMELDEGVEAWAAAMQRLLSLPAPDPAEWRATVETSAFGVRRCVADLDRIYLAELDRAG